MRKLALSSLLLLFPLLLSAQDEVGQPVKQKSEIRFPGSVGMAPAKLTGENLWVAESSKPFFVIPGVLDMVKIFKAEGPLTIGGYFADGSGEFELRQYKGPYVVIIRAAGKGKVDLLTFLEGGKEADVVRKTVEVDSGKGPIPPPPDPPIPEPADELLKSLSAAWAMEFATDKLKRDDMAALYRKAAKWAREDTALTKVKDLADKVSVERKKLRPNNELPNVHAVIIKRLDSTLPRTLNAPLDNTNRLKCSSEFDLIAQYLEKLP